MSLAHGRAQPEPLAVVRRVAELRQAIGGWRAAGLTVGLVPTMGGLHAGHRALVKRARAENDRVAATIFVNPKQFDRQGDFASYPRDEADDRSQLAAEGCHLLFAPPLDEVYPEGFSTSVTVAGLTDCLCGAVRPGHMSGVATVVTKLFAMALAERAYFGEKDYQQLLVVRRLARDLDLPTEVVAVETVREADGLALSSRNRQLTPDQRRRAPALNRILAEAAAELANGGPAEAVLSAARNAVAAAGFDPVDYLELRAADDLSSLARAERPARVFVAAWLGQVRLIDNLPVVSRR